MLFFLLIISIGIKLKKNEKCNVYNIIVIIIINNNKYIILIIRNIYNEYSKTTSFFR